MKDYAFLLSDPKMVLEHLGVVHVVHHHETPPLMKDYFVTGVKNGKPVEICIRAMSKTEAELQAAREGISRIVVWE
jgi:hypothetical protein